MTKNHATPFYDGYSYNFGDLRCSFTEDPEGRWSVRIDAPGHDTPLFITPPAPDKSTAYASARRWCAARAGRGA